MSAEEAGEVIDHHGTGVIFERDGRVAGYATVDEGGETILLADPGDHPGPALEALVAWLGERGHHEVETYAGDARRIACSRRTAAATGAPSSISNAASSRRPRPRRDGRAIGWVVGRVFSDGRGWVEQLAVARSARGLGLGRALMLHSLAELRSRGATSLATGVQAANENAIGLYRDIGFAVEREWRVYAMPTA